MDLPTTKMTYKLPDILSPDEVQRIIKSAKNIKHKALLMLIYGAGLRKSEALNLQVKDIDRNRMMLHIRNTKNRKDRFVTLPKKVLEILENYWRAYRFTHYLFPGRDLKKPLNGISASNIFISAKKKADVKKDGGIHSLRHAFATHLLEAGTDLFTIKTLLGHTCIHSTIRYLAFVPERQKNYQSPVDRLDI